MEYQRKTQDEWTIQGDYGHGWEDECSEDDRAEARQRLREYRENSPYPSRLVKRRVAIPVAEGAL